MTSCKYGSFQGRYIRLKPDDRINKNHRAEKYLTIGPKMQKTGPNHYLPNIAFKKEVNVTIGSHPVKNGT